MKRLCSILAVGAVLALPATAFAGGSVINAPKCPNGYEVNEMAYCQQINGTKILWHYQHGQVIDQPSPGKTITITSFTPTGYVSGGHFHTYSFPSQSDTVKTVGIVLLALLAAVIVSSMVWEAMRHRRRLA